MSKLTDQEYLGRAQYGDSSHLDARVDLHRRFSTNPRGWFNWVFDRLERAPADAVLLELGCGPGYLWAKCATRVPPGWQITLSDFSQGMLDASRRNLAGTGIHFSFEQIDAQQIPYPDGYFDIVIANHMLYHVPDRPRTLAEIRRVLKPGGRLLASTVGARHFTELNAWMRRTGLKGMFSGIADSFSLENGLEQLSPSFSDVKLARYPDSLRVTEVKPLLAYIRSTISAEEIPQAALAGLGRVLQQELNEKGELIIQNDTGLFEAVK